MTTFETPSRIWRRIEAGEARNDEMPSLPSFPGFDDDSHISDESHTSHILDNSQARSRSRSRSLRLDRSEKTINHVDTRRSRTPSLSRTISSGESSTAGQTPQGSVSLALEGSFIPPPSPEISMHTSGTELGRTPEREYDISSFHSVELEDQEGLNELRNSKRSNHTSISLPHSRSVDMVDMSLDEEEEPDAQHSEAPSSISYPSMSDPSSAAKSTPLPAIHEVLSEEHDIQASLSPATPQPQGRRKSFLLDVINSSARPRFSYNPNDRASSVQFASPNATPGPSIPRPVPGLRAEIAKRRLSHPLSQVQTFEPATPMHPASRESSQTPSGSNTSIVSTASSHDLTVYPRANASFDPSTGAKGVGRFNAGKLNSYLHGLNRRLQEENEALLEQLRVQAEELDRLARRSGGAGELSGVMEDAAAEGWLQEKEALEGQMDALKADVHAVHSERDTLAEELEGVKSERARDKERWKERMAEVEEGVGKIIQDLEKKLQDAEGKAAKADEAERRAAATEDALRSVRVEHGLLEERARKAELLMATEKDLGTELNAANEHITHLQVELQNTRAHLADSTRQCEEWKRKAETVELTLTSEEDRSNSLQKDLQAVKQSLASSEKGVLQLEQHAQSMEQQLQEQQAAYEDLEMTAEAASDRIEELEHLLQVAEERAQKASSVNKSTSISRSMSSKSFDVGLETRDDVKGLEAELAQAHSEIGRLQTMLKHSKDRRAVDEANEARFEALEAENKHLRALQSHAAVSTPNRATPNKSVATGTYSPFHKQLMSMYLKTPKTPGGVSHLKDMSWLSNMSLAAPASPLVAEVNRLQRRLDEANIDIDDKLNQLEEAGFDIFGMSKDLHDLQVERERLSKELDNANQRIDELEKALRSEQSRARSASAEQSRTSDKQSELLAQLQKAESLTRSLKANVQDLERRNTELERASLDNDATRETVRKLEALLAENKETITRLRDDRTRIANERIELQRRLLKAEELNDDVRKRYDDSHLAHEKREHDLDKYVSEVNKLKKTLDSQLQNHKAVLKEKNQDESLVAQFKRTVASLEAKLASMRKEVEIYGRDLQSLHAERMKAEAKFEEEHAKQERLLKQEQERVKALTRKAHEQQEAAEKVAEEFRAHVCSGVSDDFLRSLREQHKEECKGLMLQIRYAKAKYIRESGFRADLGFQKEYLLVLLSRFEKSEEKILATIAQIGFPASSPPRRRTKSFKSVVFMTICISRMKRKNDSWRNTRTYKELLSEAHEDVRRRRAESS